MPVIVARKPSAPAPAVQQPKRSSFFTLSSLSKPVSITQSKSYSVLTSTSTIPVLPSSKVKGTRFKPKASQASVIRSLSSERPAVLPPKEKPPQPVVEPKEKTDPKPPKQNQELKSLLEAENKRALNRMSEQSRRLMNDQITEASSVVVLSRYELYCSPDRSHVE